MFSWLFCISLEKCPLGFVQAATAMFLTSLLPGPGLHLEQEAEQAQGCPEPWVGTALASRVQGVSDVRALSPRAGHSKCSHFLGASEADVPKLSMAQMDTQWFNHFHPLPPPYHLLPHLWRRGDFSGCCRIVSLDDRRAEEAGSRWLK